MTIVSAGVVLVTKDGVYVADFHTHESDPADRELQALKWAAARLAYEIEERALREGGAGE